MLSALFKKVEEKNSSLSPEEAKEREDRVRERFEAEDRGRFKHDAAKRSKRTILQKKGAIQKPNGTLLHAPGRGRPRVMGTVCCAMAMYTSVLIALGLTFEGETERLDKLHEDSRKSERTHRALQSRIQHAAGQETFSNADKGKRPMSGKKLHQLKKRAKKQ